MKRTLERFIAIAVTALSFLSTAARADGGETTDFAWLSVAPEIGFQHFFPATVNDALNAEISSRNSWVVKGHVDIGGDGLAIELAPHFAKEFGSGLFGDFYAFGGQATLVFRAGFGNLYPTLGVGFHYAYIFENDYLSSGAEFYVRAPLGLTWYFTSFLGLVLEMGFYYGGTGVRAKATESGDLVADSRRSALAASDSIETGAGFALDFMMGLRFP